jgi:hypothetical protein
VPSPPSASPRQRGCFFTSILAMASARGCRSASWPCCSPSPVRRC